MDKKIIIDQAVINAKNYSDPNSYKFVNAILDKII
jgi:transcription termination factor NusB